MTVNTVLYPHSGSVDHVDISRDGQVLMLGSGDAPDFSTQFILLSTGETLWEGNMEYYNSLFESALNLYVAGRSGVEKISLKNFFDLIYRDAFEGP